ncbi:SUZ domain-containing protein 1 isoform X1 [Corythoichthys intestinalis]|uniref:SUZ domain-containing protein 1 isoform X1 n=1 Tax=Corythoichthys intestinalis TaxID=161448 RepID=UPI0025A57C06|nr:SUZ domain-containing protein 1 isoform X1 [Corythoichthys intestinalis]XP_061803641.1 SUZ domain-containing protein 1 [Nerophis lumbriciformis]
MDEEVAESWEEAADNGEMEKRLEEKLRISQKEKESSNHHCSSRSPLRMAMVIQDDSLPAAPPPQIRILKRPTNNGSLGSPLNQNRPTPQVKSLAQREAEYAEARKRILGSACPEETGQDKNNADRAPRTNSTLPSEDTRSTNHTVRQPTSPDGTQGFRQHR